MSVPYFIVCASCNQQTNTDLKEGHQEFVCPSCGVVSKLLFAKVRSKNSRANKQNGSRFYGIRVKHSGIEDFIEFNGPYQPFEIRNGDLSGFIYEADGRLAVVQNLTLNRFLMLPKPVPASSSGCMVAMIVAVVIIFLLVLIKAIAH